MLFADTGNLTYEIKSDVYEECFKHKHLFDFRNCPKDSKFFDKANKKVIGKMKDVSEGKIIDDFVGLKFKMYSMKNINGKESNMAKGVNIVTEFNEFKDTLFNKKVVRHKMKRIQSKKQNWSIQNQQTRRDSHKKKRFTDDQRFTQVKVSAHR